MSVSRDAGLQPERTELSWRRTLLSLAVGALVSVRLLPEVLGSWTIVSGLFGIAVAALLWVLARRRHRLIERVFQADAPTAEMPGGSLLLALTLFTCSAAVLGSLYALVPHR